MPKHTNAIGPCPACSAKLLQAHPLLVEWFNTVVKPKHQDCHISWSYRGKEDQEKAFLDHKSKLHFPLSMHNKSDDQGNPCSLALDFFELDYNGIGRWAWKYFKTIADEAQETEYKIIWGGSWAKQGLADYDHFQITLEKDS